jgi:hypothetical protein
MRRAGLRSTIVALSAVAAVAIPQVASASGYPSPAAVAHQMKLTINTSAATQHYKWRYSKVTCVQPGADGTLLCAGIARWSFGFGRVMNSSKWQVTTTNTGDWTAKSLWVFSGHVGP